MLLEQMDTRLAKTNIEIDKKNINEQCCIVPQSGSELTRSLSDKKDCKISLVDNQASFGFSSVTLTTKQN